MRRKFSVTNWEESVTITGNFTSCVCFVNRYQPIVARVLFHRPSPLTENIDRKIFRTRFVWVQTEERFSVTQPLGLFVPVGSECNVLEGNFPSSLGELLCVYSMSTLHYVILN